MSGCMPLLCPAGLQRLINATEYFGALIAMVISTEKTKMMVFQEAFLGPLEWPLACRMPAVASHCNGSVSSSTWEYMSVPLVAASEHAGCLGPFTEIIQQSAVC